MIDWDRWICTTGGVYWFGLVSGIGLAIAARALLGSVS